jgi:hypothetical protein
MCQAAKSTLREFTVKMLREVSSVGKNYGLLNFGKEKHGARRHEWMEVWQSNHSFPERLRLLAVASLRLRLACSPHRVLGP